MSLTSRADAQFSTHCRAGTCRTCAVKVIDGVPGHCGPALRAAECKGTGPPRVCVSRDPGEHPSGDV